MSPVDTIEETRPVTLRQSCTTPGVGRRVVIMGGGYAGTTCAVTLAKHMKPEDEIEILLVEPNPCQQALSELDLVAVGPPKPQFCELWHPVVFKDLPVTACYNYVEEVRPEEHVVVVGAGEEISYWRLVIASGAIPSLPPIPGLREHAITMWSVDDAQLCQQKAEVAFKEAARIADRERRRARLSFTVVGGGATGVEMMGTMAQLLPKRMRASGLDPADLKLHLIEARPQILYDLHDKQRMQAIRRLEHMNVRVLTGSPVDRVEDGVVHLEDGREVDSAILLWAGGARADPHAIQWGLDFDNSGRLVVDPELKATGCEDVYVVGDVASARDPETNAVLPMLAQMAIQEGPHAAENILREARGEKVERFEPHLRGEFVSVGPRWGVGWMYGLSLRGLPAIFMKRLTYVKYWLQVGGLRLAWKRSWEMLRMGW